MFSQLHFQHPLWLFAFIPLILVLWMLLRSRPNASAWEKIIDHKLLPYLLQGKQSKVSKLPLWLLASGGLIAIIALADPVWHKIPRPVFQTNTARVIVLDLSNSMLVGDLKPSRLARARFKIEDILSREDEGQTGLVVFAGDAFTASPLTRDVDTIRNLLQVFTPRLMPAQGSRVDYGLEKAHELLKQANITNGQVLLIADGVSNPEAAYRAAKALYDDGHSVSVLAVGTEKGGLLRLRTKRVNIPLDADSLKKIAKNGGGGYHLITANNTDLNHVLKQTVNANNATNAANTKRNKMLQKGHKADDLKSNDWKSTGPYLLFILIPLAALAFRKGWLFNIVLVIGLSSVALQPKTVYAASLGETLESSWQKLWFNNEQLADKALKQKQFKQASQLSQAPLRKGTAEFKGKDYQTALQSFEKAQGADARYNEGNTLAKLKKYKEALEAYKKALKLNPNMDDAKANKKAIEDFLKKQKQKQKQQKKNNKQQSKNNKQKNKQNKDQKNQQQKKNGKKQDKKDQNKKSGKKNDKQGKQKKSKENQFDKANKNLDKKNKADDKDEQQNQQQKKQAQAKKNQAQKDQAKKKDAQKEKAAKAKQAQKKKSDKQQKLDKAKAEADKLNKEERMAAEQWLRRIPDDPGGLLRRKFRRQYQRSNRRPNNEQQPW